jgi:wobble nucleotide-excising tRNase
MIQKIEKLISIGKFRNYQASGDVAFKKLTLFYGDNGGGKTTLTAIIRSLTQNKPELIRRRKSTNQTIAQTAQIIERNQSGDTYHTYNATTGWNSPLPDIEIFDIHFVNENIYSGFDFNDEHKKQLHQFVIGAVGVAIQQQIEQNKIAKAASRQIQATLVQQIIQQVGSNLTTELIPAFLTIPATQANNIDQLIATAEAALISANANSIIQTLQPLSQLSPIISGIDFPTLLTDLQTTSQAIQDTTLRTLFATHCQDLLDNNIDGPENWLKTGYAYLESKQENLTDESPAYLLCPFCQQSLSNNIDIIKAYTIQFNDEFNSLVQRIQAHLISLQSFNLETAIQGLNNINQINSGRITSWSVHLPNTVTSPNFNIINDEGILRTEFQSLLTAVQLKLQNPSVAGTTTSASVFQSSLQTINANINNYNQSVTAYNGEITTFRTGIQTIAQAQLEVDRLKRIKKRFDAAVLPLCNQLITEKQTLRGLETDYTQLSQQQQAAATTFFTSYKNRINHYLGSVFKTLFRIDDVVHVPPQGRATHSKIGYKLTIDGQDISFDPSQQYSAKDCLSEGDKSTIALAFFLSKLDIDTGIANKILVFDDPLSSFDSNRRMYTVQIIKDLFPNIKQVIVLSHNEFFLYELSKGFAGGDKKTLRFTEDFIAKASVIEPLILESMVENDYFKHIKELENFLQHPDLNKKEIVLGWLRNVLESHIRFKFYRQLSGLTANNQTFGNLITTLISQGVVFRDNANHAAIISKLNLINGISCKPHHGEPIPDYTSLGANPNTMNVTELANFVIDTLDLIDNRL